MKITWLADTLRAAGLDVVEHTNWKNHGRPGTWEPRFIVVHATAAPRTQSDATQVRIVRDGRSDLLGPIANATVDRLGRWHVLSAGRCNTTLAGTAGPFKGLGNTNALGIEACNDNGLKSPAEKWPTVQYDSYVQGVAAICRKMEWTSARAVGHKEHCPGRKTDPTFTMNTFRTAVTKAIAAGNPPKEDDMPSVSDIWGAKFGRGANIRTAGLMLAEARSAAVSAFAATAAAKVRDEAILKAVLSADDGAAVIARIDALQAELEAVVSGLPAAILAELPEAFDDEEAEEIQAAVTRALATLND